MRSRQESHNELGLLVAAASRLQTRVLKKIFRETGLTHSQAANRVAVETNLAQPVQ